MGSRLIQGLLDEAARRGHAVSLDVLAVNQQAHALYQRLGFHDLARHGENNIKIRMSSARPGDERSTAPSPEQARLRL
ncbi:GNAT family N-acetyltransferase [Frankia sp. AgB1.9]|uniref:GNAT family N-acetyltransferase n=1 Tax=unclassified Frankia TaxID=2632575 RepID=UPI00193198F5|nr:GNAT family N-acetyltransferase [Frankia sp. AgW1.1]MBL7550530.1 GNAT family N-acetyltransferase [Frankia sp. AgB1.9]MBL7624954.1 GNAT family N-acetyltransferase [Frankia sp. AgB1.8]